MTRQAKKALLLFARASSETGASDPQKLLRLMNNARSDISFETGFFEDAEYVLTPKYIYAYVNGQPIDRYDVVYFRYWGLPAARSHALALARYCKLKKIPYVDNEVFHTGSYNKINQYINLFEAKIPFPSTVVCSASRMSELAKEHMTFPFVAKDARGTRGSTNFLIESSDQLAKVLTEHTEKTFVLQQYIPNKGDYRLFVTGSKVALAIYRESRDGYLNNTSQGAKARLVSVAEIKPEMIEDAIQASKFFGRDIAGVDMVIDSDNKHYCFEVNRAPQIENSSFEQDKARAVAEFLLDVSGAP